MKKAVTLYNNEHFTEFVVETNNKKSLIFKCKNGVYRQSESNGSRPKQHHNFLGCTASIQLYKSQKDSQTIKVTKVSFEHNNHAINERTYNVRNTSLNSEEESLVRNLTNANAKTSQIKRILSNRFQKQFTTQRLKNIIKGISEADNEDNSLAEYLTKVEEEGGQVHWSNDSSGQVNVIFLSSSKMLSAMRSSNPPLIQVDTSFDIDKARYKIAAFCYLNPTTNKTEIGAVALLADESAKNLDFIFEKFAEICVHHQLIFIVDKDFHQLDSIKRNFPEAILLLCRFHCLKYMHGLFATALLTVEQKQELNAQFKTMLYSRTEEIFRIENSKFPTKIGKPVQACGRSVIALTCLV